MATEKQPEKAPEKALTVQEKNISDSVLSRCHELEKTGGIQFPANYSIANALKSAYLVLQDAKDKNDKPVLEVCTKESIANTLLDMVIQGLSVVKRQCYFIAYGNKLTLMRSYLGTVVATKRLTGVENVFANCIYEGDVFQYTINQRTGLKEILKHEQSFENIDNSKILGAYAVIVRTDQPSYIEIMNYAQIKNSWSMGSANGNSKAHNKFAEEMSKKSVIARACKSFIGTSDDADLLIGAINNTLDDIQEAESTVVEEDVKKEIAQNANQTAIDIVPETKPEPKQEPKNGKVAQEDMFGKGPGF